MKQKTYTGTGIMECMDICKRYNLNSNNSHLKIKNSGDLNSKWTIITKR